MAQTTEIFTTPGQVNWTCPAGITSVAVVAVGSGGGSGGAAANCQTGGGAGGDVASGSVTVVPGQIYPVRVGAPGVAGTTSLNGGNGNLSSFNTTPVIGYGGRGSTFQSTNTAASGGVGQVGNSVGTSVVRGGQGGLGTASTRCGGGGGGAGGVSIGGASAAGAPGVGGTGYPPGGNGGNGNNIAVIGTLPGYGGGAGGSGSTNGNAGGGGYLSLTYGVASVGQVAAPTATQPSGATRTVTLSWPVVSDATSYTVYRDGVSIGSTAALTFNDTGLTADGTYTYTATSSNAGATSPQSAGTVVEVARPSWNMSMLR